MGKEIEVLEKIRDYCRHHVNCKRCKYGNAHKDGCAFGYPGFWKLEMIKKEEKE